MDRSRPGFVSISPSLLRLMSMESALPSNHLILWRRSCSCSHVLSVVNSAAVNSGCMGGRMSLTIEFYVTTSLSTNSFNCIIYGSILMAVFSPPYGSLFLFLACLILSDGKSDHMKFIFWCWIFLLLQIFLVFVLFAVELLGNSLIFFGICI